MALTSAGFVTVVTAIVLAVADVRARNAAAIAARRFVDFASASGLRRIDYESRRRSS